MRLGTAIECLVDNYKYASDKEWINDKVAWALYHTWKEADRTTEPTISKMEQVDKDINVRSKDEPQTHEIRMNTHECVKDTHDKTEPRKEQNFCGKCRYLYRDFKYGLSCYRLMDNEPCKYEERKAEPQTERKCIDCNFLTYMFGKTWCNIKCENPHGKVCDRFKPKDEPTTQTETQNSNLTFKTLEYCDICDHKGCEECIANALDEHCIPSQFKKQIEDECAKEYEELGLKELKELIKADRKTEPNSSEKPNNCETQIDELKEAKILLKASRDLLNKQNETIYVLNLLEETVEYHGTECDGYCLIDDIDDWLLQTEPQTDVYDYKGNGKWERSE